MANDGRPPAGLGCLSTIIGAVVLAAVVVLFFFVGLVALAVVAGLLVLGLIVWAVDRVLLALSPARRERRASQRRAFDWRSGPFVTGEVIDTTATESTGDWTDPRPGSRPIGGPRPGGPLSGDSRPERPWPEGPGPG